VRKPFFFFPCYRNPLFWTGRSVVKVTLRGFSWIKRTSFRCFSFFPCSPWGWFLAVCLPPFAVNFLFSSEEFPTSGNYPFGLTSREEAFPRLSIFFSPLEMEERFPSDGSDCFLFSWPPAASFAAGRYPPLAHGFFTTLPRNFSLLLCFCGPSSFSSTGRGFWIKLSLLSYEKGRDLPYLSLRRLPNLPFYDFSLF